MSYTPPTTFVDGTTLTSAALEGNFEALRVYLHSGVVAGDMEAAKWIDTRHVQPPRYEPFSQVQHGVTGHQGGSDSGMVRLTFCTKYRSGQGRTSSNTFHAIPQTAIDIQVRKAASILFHYWWEIEAGPDNSGGAGTESNTLERLVWVCPYVGSVEAARSTYIDHAQEVVNNTNGALQPWRVTAPRGAQRLYTTQSAYQSRDGTLMHTLSGPGTTRFGLAAHSQVGRAGVVNWGVSIETFYL